MKDELNFYITSIVWHEIGDKLIYHHHPMYDVLNMNLNIKNYGNALESISMICVAQPPFNAWRDNYILFNEKKKELEWQYILDYDTILRNDFHQNRQLLAHAYLEALEEIERHDKIPDFDFAAFRRDVSRLFEAQAWLVKEAA